MSRRREAIIGSISPTTECPCLCFTANIAGSTVSMTKSWGTPETEPNFKTSLDGITWSDYVIDNDVTLNNVGDKVYFKGNNPNGINGYLWQFMFIMAGSIAGSGNIMSLIDDGACNTMVIPADCCFYGLFSDCTSLTTPPELPATTLTEDCYDCTFYNCSSLTIAPELPATELAFGCYYDMFGGCTSLNIQDTVNKLTSHIDFTSSTAPIGLSGIFCELPITDDILETILPKNPDTGRYWLPATTLTEYCYNNMFSLCTSLTTAPELPATTLAHGCYSIMFYGCSSLTTPPTLPATELTTFCYEGMFSDCTSLVSAPELPATTLTEDCYAHMFYNCASLTTPPSLPAMTLANRCYSQMFYKCTSLTNAPALPATELVDSCYSSMFGKCTSLTTAPVLPATTLATQCYSGMFNGCTSLIVSDGSGTGYDKEWKIPSTGPITGSKTYKQANMFANCNSGSSRASNDLAGVVGQQYVYYTQNTPV